MNEILPELPASPSQVGNFIIAYKQDLEFFEEEIDPTRLKQFIQLNKSTELLCTTDSSFFPRAFTDIDLSDLNGDSHKNPTQKENIVKTESELKESVSGSTKVGENISKMDRNFGDMSKFPQNFQPDVIVSNSNHRSGPDGSPSLIPSGSRSQGFVPSTLSETGELFAPMKTLTFSDVDQSSHIEDSYVDTSRHVSTPNKSTTQNQYNYSMANMHNFGNRDSDSDSDSDHIHIDSRDKIPEFRQLEVEPDLDLLSTGAFHPSAHGLNQEFMDNFTGRTGNAFTSSNVFSPLSGYGNQSQERFEAHTPPLHKPNPNSPFIKQMSLKSQAGDGGETEEIQFAMSPTRDSTGFTMQRQQQFSQVNSQEGQMLLNRQEFMNSDKFYEYSYPNEHTFQPIDKHPQNFMSQKAIPKNLSEYSEYQKSPGNTKHKPEHVKPKPRNVEVDSIANRQGDGYDGDLQESNTNNQARTPDSIDKQFAVVSPSSFEQRYLQRTQVSVKVPQAMYDTMTSNTSIEERLDTSDNDHNRFQPPIFPPDSFKQGDYMHANLNENRPSPEKGVDLLQTQPNVQHEVQQNQSHGHGTQLNLSNSGSKTHRDDIPITDNKKAMKNEQNVSNNADNVSQSETGVSSGMVSATVQVNPNQKDSGVEFSQTHENGSVKNLHQNPSGAAQTQSAKSAQQQSQIPQPSSRLLQETISKKSKVNQKFVSNNPAMSKSVPGISKDQSKAQDPVRRGSNTTVSAGTRKTITNESEKQSMFKSKSMSSETLSQKQKSIQNPGRQGNRTEQHISSHNSQPSNQMKRDIGTNQRGNHGNQIHGNQGYGNQGHSKGQGHNHSIEGSTEDGHVITQVQTVSPVPMEQTTSMVKSAGETSLDTRGMEEVRHQLQSMLRLSHDAIPPQERTQYEHSEILAGFGVGDQSRQMDMSWNMQRKPADDEMSDLFPSFSSSQFLVDSGNVSRSDASVHLENQRLRDMIEKERYRRKHCEQYIQQLNVKLLETQQQVAVAVSTDKRKDIMIEQLDKQLAVVMEGWKKRDLEKDAVIGDIRKEKDEVEQTLQQQQQMINNFEHDMSHAVETLRDEKEKAAQTIADLKEQLVEVERSRNHDKELLSAEQEKADLHQQECDSLREARDTLDKKLDNMQRRLHREQDEWFQREQELLQRIEEVSDKNTKILQIERTKNEEQGKLAEEVMDQYQAATTKIKQLQLELDAAMREKESVKVEMGIMEAKFENAQRVLEAEMHSTMEKQIAEQVTDVQARNEHAIEHLQETHRSQVVEMNQRHGKEIENQLSVFREEVRKKEDDFRKQMNEMENRLAEYRAENSELKLSKQKLESTRLEILTKLQYAMQTQWNEAFSLLASTPQRKGQVPALSVSGASSGGGVETQSLPSVSFSLANAINTLTNFDSHSNNPANQTTPTKNNPTNQNHSTEHHSSNQDSPGRGRHHESSHMHQRLSNQSTPEGHMTNQNHTVRELAEDSQLHSTPKQRQTQQSAETTAMMHMQQYQDFMDRVAQTPDWISSINTQPPQPVDNSDRPSLQPADIPDRPSPALPQPPDLAALISAHFQNLQQHQVKIAMSSLPTSAHNSMPVTSLPNTSANFDTHLQTSLQSINSNTSHRVQLPSSPPKVANSKSANQTVLSEAVPSFIQSDREAITHGWSLSAGGQGYGDTSDLSCAVPIRPPQQREDPYLHDDTQSVISSIAGSHLGYNFQGGQSFSPPTKQSRPDDSPEDLTHHSLRLNEDYNNLTERMEEHESHQHELQHYIKMLLNKPPSEVGNNESMFSQDQEELDLNDTAQAAQLQRELDRIQELRQKQESAIRSREPVNSHMEQKSHQTSLNSEEGTNRILNPDQLAEVTKLLNHVKQSSQPQNPQVTELLELLKHAHDGIGKQGGPQGQRKGQKPGPLRTGPGAADRAKMLTGHKRNMQFNPAKGVEGPKPNSETQKIQPDKQAPKTAQSAKKVDRKIAGSANKGEKGPKPAAWK